MNGAQRKWIAAGIGLAVLGLLADRHWMAAGRPPVPAATNAQRRPATGPPVQATAPVPVVAAAGGDTATRYLDVCGFGRIALAPGDDFPLARFLQASVQNTGRRWLSALQDSDDYRARATGLVLQGKVGNADLSMQVMTDESRDELVQLAVGAGDPAVYAMAVYSCGTLHAPLGGSCSRISLTGWARLDPGNAVPWLQLADAARRVHDDAAESAAFAQAAAAHSVDSYNWSLYSYSEALMPADASQLERQYLSMTLMGLMAAMQPPYAILTKHCTAEAMQQTSVHDQCSQVAELMVAKGTTLLDLGIGRGLGARVGWPQPRIAALEQERDALAQTGVEASPHGQDQFTCASLERSNAYLHDLAVQGELGVTRALLERSGESVAELARRHRAYLEDHTRTAVAEGSAPE